jgi:hypothetical protein
MTLLEALNAVLFFALLLVALLLAVLASLALLLVAILPALLFHSSRRMFAPRWGTNPHPPYARRSNEPLPGPHHHLVNLEIGGAQR